MPSITSIAHKIWRALPREPRRRLIHTTIDILARPAAPAAQLRPGPVTVGGRLSTASGLGESARLCLDAVCALGWDAKWVDLSAEFLRADMQADLPGAPAEGGDGGTLILHVNGPYMPYAAMRLGRRFIRGRRIIGYWAWELPRMGDEWNRGFRYTHEIWVPSRFTQDSMPPQSRIPVKIVPHPVHTEIVAGNRHRFGLPENTFVVFAAFDMGSSYTRKNPRAAIDAFRKAFGDDPNCLMLLKIGNASDATWAMADLAGAIAGMSNVRLMQETLSSPEMAQLVASADVVLSLHRAEGFGLLLAEGMLQRLPVVATGWSGNLDFMTPDDSALIGYRMIPIEDPQGNYVLPDVSWADADVGQAADWLARLRDDPALRRAMGDRARAAALEKLSLAAYRRAIGDSLPGP